MNGDLRLFWHCCGSETDAWSHKHTHTAWFSYRLQTPHNIHVHDHSPYTPTKSTNQYIARREYDDPCIRKLIGMRIFVFGNAMLPRYHSDMLTKGSNRRHHSNRNETAVNRPHIHALLVHMLVRRPSCRWVGNEISVWDRRTMQKTPCIAINFSEACYFLRATHRYSLFRCRRCRACIRDLCVTMLCDVCVFFVDNIPFSHAFVVHEVTTDYVFGDRNDSAAGNNGSSSSDDILVLSRLSVSIYFGDNEWRKMRWILTVPS